MPVTTREDADGDTLTIAVGGHFGFSDHRAFRAAYQNRPAPAARYVVDLAGTEYMDSAALGMLLLLREHAGGERADVSILNAQPRIRQVLEIANFTKLFHIA